MRVLSLTLHVSIVFFIFVGMSKYQAGDKMVKENGK